MGGLLSKSQPNVEKPKTGSADRVRETCDRGEPAIFPLKTQIYTCFNLFSQQVKSLHGRIQIMTKGGLQVDQLVQSWASGRHIATCGDRSKISVM